PSRVASRSVTGSSSRARRITSSHRSRNACRRRKGTASTRATRRSTRSTTRMTETSVADGRYRLERPLGHGGMASVYLARDSELDRPVAVKLLAENAAADHGLRERFVREAR